MRAEQLMDPFSVRFALGSPDLLAAFNRAGVLEAADVHIASRIAALGGEEDESVVLALALAARAPRAGHVHVDLDRIEETVVLDLDEPLDPGELPWPEREAWVERVARSGVVGIEDKNPDRPLRLWGSRLYLDRYWRDERRVAAELLDRAGHEAVPADEDAVAQQLATLFPEGTDTRQALAAAAAVLGRLAVIAGGPGTGKTTTVARVAALLLSEAVRPSERLPLVALAAPTGKAAQRMGEAVSEALPDLDIPAEVRDRLEATDAVTIHRLLGWRPGSNSRFRHDRDNRLPHDVVIIDETSMVSLSLMARLLEAVRPDARLILVGDPDQLASVEAGAVLGDMVASAAAKPAYADTTRERLERLTSSAVPKSAEEPVGVANRVVTLDRVYRFEGPLAELAAAVRMGNSKDVLAILEAGHDEIRWVEADVADPDASSPLQPVREEVVGAARKLFESADAADGVGALKALSEHRVLCAHRRGPYGVAGWNPRIEAWIADAVDGYRPYGRRYLGRPLLVTQNNYELSLFNGDMGAIVRAEAGADRVLAAFQRGSTQMRLSPSQLDSVETVHAMTIHKSQGSQFDSVSVILPPPDSRLLTRELLYTAITRSSDRLTLVGPQESVVGAVGRAVERASGLGDRLQ